MEDLKIPNKIQLQEYSKSSDIDDILRVYVWRNPSGNRNVAYLNRYDAKRNLNLNYFDDDWNEYYRFAAVRNDYFFTA